MRQLQVTDLCASDFFDNLTQEERELLSKRFTTRTLERDDKLFVRGGEREALFLILEGEVAIENGEAHKHRYITCGPGKIISESSLLGGDLHSVSGVAVTNCVVAQLSLKSIEELVQDERDIFSKLLIAAGRLMARRLTNSSSSRGFGATFGSGRTRSEHDLIGDREIPNDVLWGVQTLRAIENFDISGIRLDSFPEMIESLAMIKRACAIVNCELGQLSPKHSDAIVAACDELLKGAWHGHFVVDMIQGGAGTSTNMNANEVIANRGLELLGYQRGDYKELHPNTHVNMSQSTNDVYPSAIKLTLIRMSGRLIDEIESLACAFERKGKEFSHIIKMGRTQLQDAVPMTLGQEFTAWGRTIREGKQRVELALGPLHALNMGGTAIGTGINTDPRYATMVVEELGRESLLPLELAPDLVEETQDTSGFVELAGVFKMAAVRVSKICNDLRLLSSGPRCGFNEINLPAVQPGSSIMPGKVNPVIPEVVNQVAFQVIGHDITVAMAAQAGQLELNVFEPVIAYDLFSSIHMLRNAFETLHFRCIDGITANQEVCANMVRNSIGLVTALNPHLGYEKSSEVAKIALTTGGSVYDIVLEKGYMEKDQLDIILSPQNMTQPTLNSPGNHSKK